MNEYTLKDEEKRNILVLIENIADNLKAITKELEKESSYKYYIKEKIEDAEFTSRRIKYYCKLNEEE
jgi:hypothetical protein